LAAPAKAQFDSQKPSPKPLVLLVSLDGFKPEYLSKTGSPHLFELAKNGAQAQGLISAFPSLTFPNHVTLVTGQTPDAHGIVNNVMTDPGIAQRFSPSSRAAIENPAWWQEANPLWVTLRQQGKVASTLFWPGSEAPIQHLMPNDWLRYDHHLSHQSRIDTLMVWLARNEAERPDFATLYFSDVDSAGHSAGPDSAAVRLAVRQVDDAMAHLIVRLKQQGLWSTTTFERRIVSVSTSRASGEWEPMPLMCIPGLSAGEHGAQRDDPQQRTQGQDREGGPPADVAAAARRRAAPRLGAGQAGGACARDPRSGGGARRSAARARSSIASAASTARSRRSPRQRDRSAQRSRR
jgi:hypothetical protein